ncbi:MAG TPA: CRISPR-associated helicase Cas3' [Yinghuangia sp.]|nr:CRISPR-associated helicase Cas3' [Yinghuangia sp.]
MSVKAEQAQGKTEAALVAAEVFAARCGAGGCFVALPTRATGNAMFSRVLDWLERLPGSGGGSVFLAHAKAGLNEEYVDLVRAGSRRLAAIEVDGEDDDWRPAQDVRAASGELAAHQWLRGRKTGMLASFAVGTVDQLLFAGLKSRHLALRHLALAGKVVVVDEVHAYDAYMSVYLERVLSWLGAYRVPVVMLSATLPAGRRRALAEAFAGVAGAGAVVEDERYPLITAVSAGAPARVVPVAAAGERAVEVQVARLDDDAERLVGLLEVELADGGCALVVRNTVDRVLRTAAALRERFGDDRVTVAHSRFVDLDRARVDAELVRRFGPDGDRPVGAHIVVASQVAEQSLDVDFDVLVSDLAPVDLVLQRLGRLHRHHRGGREQTGRPSRLRVPRCWITGVAWATPVPEPVPGSRAVYGRYALLRSLAVLAPHLDGRCLELPGDISGLVQAAYGEGPVGPASWQPALAVAGEEEAVLRADQRRRADGFLLDGVRRPGRSLVGWLDAGVGDADDTRLGRAQVRDAEESLEVLVVQRRADGVLVTLPWLEGGCGGVELPEDSAPAPEAARTVAGCALRLPWQFARPGVLDRAIAELEQSCFPAWQGKESPLLAGELVLVLDEDCRTRLAGFELCYSTTDGLVVARAGTGETKA